MGKLFEMLESFLKTFLRASTVHGLNHLAHQKQRHPLETCIWFLFVAASVCAVSKLSSLALRRYTENPTVISMERDRFSWNTSFPTATVCPINKLNQSRLNEFIEEAKKRNAKINTRDLKNFLVTLAQASYDNFGELPLYDEINPEDYMAILLDLAFNFKPNVANSGMSHVKGELQKTVTEMGVCYSFNSQLAVYNSPEYRKSGSWNLLQEDELFFVNPLDGDVFISLMNMSNGVYVRHYKNKQTAFLHYFQMYLHGPYEVADVDTKAILSKEGHYVQVRFSAMTIFSSSRTRHFRIGQRKCKYHDESDLKHSPVYSYVLCRIECRIQLAKRLCGCIPHFYRILGK